MRNTFIVTRDIATFRALRARAWRRIWCGEGTYCLCGPEYALEGALRDFPLAREWKPGD